MGSTHMVLFVKKKKNVSGKVYIFFFFKQSIQWQWKNLFLMKESLPPSPKNFTSILNSLSTFWFKWNLLERCVCGGVQVFIRNWKKKNLTNLLHWAIGLFEWHLERNRKFFVFLLHAMYSPDLWLLDYHLFIVRFFFFL